MRKIISIVMGLVCLASLIYSQEDIQSLKVIVNNSDGNSLEGIRALQSINKLYSISNDYSTMLSYFESVVQNKSNSEIGRMADAMIFKVLIKSNRIDDAIEKGLQIKSNYSGTRWAEESLFNLCELYMNVVGDNENAEKYFNELKANYPNSKLIKNVELF